MQAKNNFSSSVIFNINYLVEPNNCITHILTIMRKHRFRLGTPPYNLLAKIKIPHIKNKFIHKKILI